MADSSENRFAEGSKPRYTLHCNVYLTAGVPPVTFDCYTAGRAGTGNNYIHDRRVGTENGYIHDRHVHGLGFIQMLYTGRSCI